MTAELEPALTAERPPQDGIVTPPSGTVDRSDTESSNTVLRVKRKRNADPIEALVVAQEESRREGKKLRLGNGEILVFKLVETVERQTVEDAQRWKNTLEKLKSLRSEKQSSKSSSSSRPGTPDERRKVLAQAKAAENRAARYKVLKSRREERDPDLPYKVVDVAEDNDRRRQARSGTATPAENDVVASLMPMIQEYLRVTEGVEPPVSEEEYVYDLYYQDTSGATAPDARIGQLTLDQDANVFLIDEDEDSDVLDEADEDSNAEDYYQNEYPDEWESSDEDEYGYGYGNRGSDDDDDPYGSD
ncbi:hypothetical protein BC832DRAFT_591122 [Gaertneriomyces semiglobifer]|nr:hypothetical protein BC832DRAFT_591122 [Gaertneriomyces semiglobifer]